MTKEQEQLLRKAKFQYLNYKVRVFDIPSCTNYELIPYKRPYEKTKGKLTLKQFDEDERILLMLNGIECLTEEIEHPVTGEKVIPIDITTNQLGFSLIDSVFFPVEKWSYEVVELIQELHIDYLNLIPQGLAIDKRAVEQPYC